MLERIIISLELKIHAFEVHIIAQKQLGRIYTLLTDTIVNRRDQQEIYDYIIQDRLKELVHYFKSRYDLLHIPITISYGPQIRKILTGRTKTTIK